VTTWKPSSPPRSEIGPHPVSESLDRVTRGIGAPKATVLTAVFARWEELVGREVAAHAEPRSLRDGVLVIAVDQPAWATQLRFLGAELLARVREATACSDVAEIHVKVVGEPVLRARGAKRS
jgi:predicted nucleic acid-binding Zn ribbon protein